MGKLLLLHQALIFLVSLPCLFKMAFLYRLVTACIVYYKNKCYQNEASYR